MLAPSPMTRKPPAYVAVSRHINVATAVAIVQQACVPNMMFIHRKVWNVFCHRRRTAPAGVVQTVKSEPLPSKTSPSCSERTETDTTGAASRHATNISSGHFQSARMRAAVDQERFVLRNNLRTCGAAVRADTLQCLLAPATKLHLRRGSRARVSPFPRRGET